MFKKIREQLKRRETLFPYRVKEHKSQKYLDIESLKEQIANHECHLSPEDGCQCVEWHVKIDNLIK